MSEKQLTNPLREGLSTKAVPQPCAIVIFGATGDLTHRKLIPALYNIAADGELPPAVAVTGFARRPKTDDEFRSEMEEATRKFSRKALRNEIWQTFAKCFSITNANLATKKVIKNWLNASIVSTGRAARAATVSIISQLRPSSSSPSSRI